MFNLALLHIQKIKCIRYFGGKQRKTNEIINNKPQHINALGKR